MIDTFKPKSHTIAFEYNKCCCAVRQLLYLPSIPISREFQGVGGARVLDQTQRTWLWPGMGQTKPTDLCVIRGFYHANFAPNFPFVSPAILMEQRDINMHWAKQNDINKNISYCIKVTLIIFLWNNFFIGLSKIQKKIILLFCIYFFIKH